MRSVEARNPRVGGAVGGANPPVDEGVERRGGSNIVYRPLVPVVLAVVYATAVRHEEAYLEEKFGAAYLSYKSSVRRWI